MAASLAVSHPQSPIPSKAASVRTPAQKLRSELRRMVLGLGESWSEELERDVPRSWQRHGDLVLLSEDSFSAALWTKLGKGSKACSRGCRSQSCLASPSTAVLQAQRSGRRLPQLWVPSAWPGEDGCCQAGCGPLASPCCWARTAGWSTWTTASGRQERAAGHGCGISLGNGLLSPGWRCPRRYTFDVTKCMFSPGNITEKLRVALLPCAGEVLVDLYAGTSPRGQQRGSAGQACRGEQAESGDAGIDSIQMEVNRH